MTQRLLRVWFFVLLIAGGVFRPAAAQRDTTTRTTAADTASSLATGQPASAGAAVAAGIKLLGVFDANTGEWLGQAVVRDTLGNETITSGIGVAALNVLAPVMGMYMIEIRKPGYAPQRFKLKADTAAEFLVALLPNPLGTVTALPATITTAPRTILNRDEGTREGFFQRCSTKLVDCVGRKDLDVRPTDPIGMLLKQNPGLTVTCPLGWTCHTQMQSTFPTGRNNSHCNPTFFVNGSRWLNGEAALDELLSAPVIAGIEVYLAGMPIPPRFDDPETHCGAIVIWTR